MNTLSVGDVNNLIHWLDTTQPNSIHIARIRKDLVNIAIAINGGVDE